MELTPTVWIHTTCVNACALHHPRCSKMTSADDPSGLSFDPAFLTCASTRPLQARSNGTQMRNCCACKHGMDACSGACPRCTLWPRVGALRAGRQRRMSRAWPHSLRGYCCAVAPGRVLQIRCAG